VVPSTRRPSSAACSSLHHGSNLIVPTGGAYLVGGAGRLGGRAPREAKWRAKTPRTNGERRRQEHCEGEGRGRHGQRLEGEGGPRRGRGERRRRACGLKGARPGPKGRWGSRVEGRQQGRADGPEGGPRGEEDSRQRRPGGQSRLQVDGRRRRRWRSRRRRERRWRQEDAAAADPALDRRRGSDRPCLRSVDELRRVSGLHASRPQCGAGRAGQDQLVREDLVQQPPVGGRRDRAAQERPHRLEDDERHESQGRRQLPQARSEPHTRDGDHGVRAERDDREDGLRPPLREAGRPGRPRPLQGLRRDGAGEGHRVPAQPRGRRGRRRAAPAAGRRRRADLAGGEVREEREQERKEREKGREERRKSGSRR
jgi:hypothetical protein